MIVRWQLIFGLILASLSQLQARKVADSSLQFPSKCPMLTECPMRAEPCDDDDDCSADAICCTSPCGKICTKQLFTGCQTLRMAAARRAKAFSDDDKAKKVRMPRCSKTGSFEPIQCDNEIASTCWCVDEAGFEKPGTRAPAAALVNCTAPKPCADHTCRMFCPYGFSVDKEGCPLCKCRDPCDDVHCPGTLQCHLEELACADPPCPPVPTCKKGRSLENVCPIGEPLRISDTVRPFLCGNEASKPQCPPLYQCLVQKGNDYGVCCPASLKIQKTGTCPAKLDAAAPCGTMCSHDLECPSIQKCCHTEECGMSCIHPENITECFHQKALSEVLAVSERAGRGYVPQCTDDGQFEPKQCSRNGLVCWCVDRLGRKIKGSMGAAENVNCSMVESRYVTVARSIDKNTISCEEMECAQVCEYGFKLDENGCHTCKCDDPCAGYTCPEDEECVNVKEASCTDFLCPSLPVCRPKAVYANPCASGTPLTDELRGAPVACARTSAQGVVCPANFECTAVAGSTQAVCCPMGEESVQSGDQEVEESEDYPAEAEQQRQQTMCEYLHDFSESMEGTRDGMKLALPTPECDENGNYLAQQCDQGLCWCVDNFGTEIPNTKAEGLPKTNCTDLRESMECLDLTCRMGCEYGFVLNQDTGCPNCQCRDPCSSVTCKENEQCQLVEVSCRDHYCPPVPACLPKKVGQCPYLIPATSTSCNFQCSSDLACNGTMRCCSNGCGTQCTEPLLLTGCQHSRLLAEHHAREAGIPVSKAYIPACSEDGSWSSKQCDVTECWCVDERGIEISKSRTKDKEMQCENVSEEKVGDCAQIQCEEECEHGVELDENGCRTCRCVDPCSKISCRGEGEACRTVAIECVSEDCPSVPVCLPQKENPCQNGNPLLGPSGEEVICGPGQETCPSSHKCQLSPVGEYAVCCPKPRDVCFEPLDKGEPCDDSEEESRNFTRYHFNPSTNKCENFIYTGCGGNHNNFHTEGLCNGVCPVLSQCERLREKNQRTSQRLKKPTFLPRCDIETGNWLPVQCLEHVGVCWCVNPKGEPLKGTLIRGKEPECSFRKARGRSRDGLGFEGATGGSGEVQDLVLEELMQQLSAYTEEEDNKKQEHDEVGNFEIPSKTRCEALGGQCDSDGKFLPLQCEKEICWCVNEAGNQIPNTNTFVRGDSSCVFTPIEAAEVTLGFKGQYDDITAERIVSQMTKIINNLHGNINSEGLEIDLNPGELYVKVSLIGSNKVDVGYKIEQMIMNRLLPPGFSPDISRSRVTFKQNKEDHDRLQDNVLALEHREIVSQSPVSVVAPYHTALIVIAAASAFVICVLTLLMVLYRRKINSLAAQKAIEEDRYLAANSHRPIYIELPSEKQNGDDKKEQCT
ncbi:unnamed protein product [Callosobruchus maculatus]|uniref:Thyroglobulin type-1 domain-containing protein n=1 Tax=Callosobruchus maculatus TaxID=64391 RepID=A0A653BJK4_CALMS|nr:unnamed protein product [Callosobruchus maculatus]